MKQKLLLFGFAVLTIAAVTTFTMNVNSNDYGLSDISLANVEALALGEGDDGTKCGCMEWDKSQTDYGGVKCPCTNGNEYTGKCSHWCQ